MKLKRVELFGFKSFVERTALDFEVGITSILGPNGCGKTNIVDAIRWVLGEQSAKQLRGAIMEDIIFKGSAKRKPVGFAEVALTFTNDDRAIPVDFTEVTVKRRVERDGISRYSLNNTPCRLKDLRDLFYDSGVNNTTYSVIEQSMINQVLNEHTQELRNLLEEGSGIIKYKARRKEALRKLEQTEQDLLRLRDLLDEIGREVRSLARQVGKARRFQRLFREIRALDLALAEKTHRQLGDREIEIGVRIGELKALAEAEVGELADLRARIEAARPAFDEREAERRGLEESLRAYEEELQESERRVLVLEHRIEEHRRRAAEAAEGIAGALRRGAEIKDESALLGERRSATAERVAQIAAELREREGDRAAIEERHESERRALTRAAQLNLAFVESDATQKGLLRELTVKRETRQERLRVLADEEARQQAARDEAARAATDLVETAQRLLGKRAETLSTLAGLERERDAALDQATEQRQQLATREARREALTEHHELLRRIKDEYRGYGQAAKRLLKEHGRQGGVLGSVPEWLQVDHAYGEAFENLLAELVDAVVVEGRETAVDLIGRLREQASGRASFLCRGGETSLPQSGAVPAGGRPARDVVQGEGAKMAPLARLLASAWLFDDDAAAMAAAAAHGASEAVPILCLSPSGLLVSSDGIVRGGQGRSEETSLLGRSEKLEQLEAQLAAVSREIETWGLKADASDARQRELQEYLTRGRAELAILGEDLSKVNVEAAAARSREGAAAERIGAIAQERERLAHELEALEVEASALHARVSESDRERSDSGLRHDELQELVRDLETRRDEARAAVETLRLAHQNAESELREIEASRTHLDGSAAELTAREASLRQEQALLEQEVATLTAELAERKQTLQDGFQERERRRQLVAAAGEAIHALHAETATWHDRVKQIEDKRADCREQSHGLETELATLDVRRRNLIERVEEQYKGQFRELVRSVDPEALPRELVIEEGVFQTDQANGLLGTRREALAELGPVNHLAIEEYETKKERLKFLEGQLKDIEKAKEDLTTAIAQINRTARKLFADTFEEVRRNYIAVFQTLFEGGKADLELIKTDDPLEGQIRIHAQPGGKLIDHVGLLSGGERCLTALSLLFAVYLVKPAPFCLLDEVDAPLDDPNTGRFIKMLHKFSDGTQFLVVTHNKLTMEAANHLYGVTMMEPGVSSIVSVSFQDVAETQSDTELAQAIATRRRELDRQAAARKILAEEEPAAARRFTLAADENGEGDENGIVDESASGMFAVIDESEPVEQDEPVDGGEMPVATDDAGVSEDDAAAQETARRRMEAES